MKSAGLRPIPVLRPRLPPFESPEAADLRRIDETRIYSNYGPLSLELERRLSSRLGLPEGGVTCAASGTAALAGAILAVAGRAPEARPLAVLPAFTFVATALAVEQCGYRGFLTDIDLQTWMLDADRLLSHPELHRVGLIVPVAPFGRPVPQEPWRRFREKTGIPVVIDGAGHRPFTGRLSGRRSGGVELPCHQELLDGRGRRRGVDKQRAHQARGTGSQFRILRKPRLRDVEHERKDERVSRRGRIGGARRLGTEKLVSLHALSNRYRSLLSASNLTQRLFASPAISAAYVLFLCRDLGQCLGIRKALGSRGVDFRFWYGEGLQQHTYFSGFERDELPVTESVAPRLLGLPVAPDLSDSAIRRVVAGLEAGAGI